MDRRTFLIATSLPVLSSCVNMSGVDPTWNTPSGKLLLLEKKFDVRIGVYAINTQDNSVFSYRGNERFAFCSTFKFLVAAAILQRSVQTPELMRRHISFTADDVKKSGYAPVTEQHVDTGMSVAELCAAMIEYSDNGAANQLLKIMGGPGAINDFVRVIGDDEFRLDRWEPELNSAIPGDVRDTTTPSAMAKNMRRLALDDGLPAAQKLQLQGWLRANSTGDARIRAGVPASWQVGDKTGTGDYGVANDVAVLWPAQTARAPIVLAIFTNQVTKTANANDDVVASAARIVVDTMR